MSELSTDKPANS